MAIFATIYLKGRKFIMKKLVALFLAITVNSVYTSDMV